MKRQDDGSVTLTREELYEHVWSTPMRRLAKEYGLSDVGIAKLCKRHKIPRPSVGYWAKKEVGKKVNQPNLPPIDDPALANVTLRQPLSRAEETLGPEVLKRIEAERHPSNQIVVKKRLASPHRLVARTIDSLRHAKPDERRLVRSFGKDTLPVSVAPQTVDRAMRILDALVRSFERRPYHIVTNVEHRKGICVSVDDERVEFTLKERLRQEGRELTPSEQRDRSWLASGLKYTYHPTGRLSLEIVTYGSNFSRRTWTDGKKQRLETCLNDFMIALLETAEANKIRRREREEENRRREAWRLEQEKKLLLIQEEEQRVARLEAEVKSWHLSQRIREYVETVRAAAADRSCDIRGDEKLARWVEWALAQADRLDPLVDSPPSILDEKHKWENNYVTHW